MSSDLKKPTVLLFIVSRRLRGECPAEAVTPGKEEFPCEFRMFRGGKHGKKNQTKEKTLCSSKWALFLLFSGSWLLPTDMVLYSGEKDCFWKNMNLEKDSARHSPHTHGEH